MEIPKQKYNFNNSDRNFKNKLILEKKFPFINFSVNKKKGGLIGNEIYFPYRNNRKYNENGNLNYDFLTDRMRNKKIKSNNTKSNYNNNSVNNFFGKYIENK